MVEVQLTTERPIAEEIDVVSCLMLGPVTQHCESLACETRATRATECNQSAAAQALPLSCAQRKCGSTSTLPEEFILGEFPIFPTVSSV